MDQVANPQAEAQVPQTEAQQEQSILERIQNSRGELEQPTPTDEDATTDQELEVETNDLNGSDEPEQPEGEPIETEQAELYTVKVNGEEKQVSLEDLQAGYSMESDYRQKTAAIAEERRAFEEKVAEKNTKLDAHIESLELILKASEEAVDWDYLRDTDTAEYLRLKEQKAEREEAVNKAKSERQAEMQKQNEQYIARESEALFEAMPAWKDEAVRVESMNAIASVAESLGIKQEEMTDHRFFIALDEVAKYRELMSKSDAKVKEIKATPKTIKSSKQTRKPVTGDLDAARQKYQKTGSDDALLDMFKLKLNRNK